MLLDRCSKIATIFKVYPPIVTVLSIFLFHRYTLLDFTIYLTANAFITVKIETPKVCGEGIVISLIINLFILLLKFLKPISHPLFNNYFL